jgi:lysophospholipase L1-like esterase
MQTRRTLFHLILITPALMLLVLLLAVGFDLHALRAVDPAAVASALRDRLAARPPESFPPPEKLFTLDPGKQTAFLFGASSLVLSDGAIFPDYLERISNGLQTVNFGVSGIDSFSVRLRVGQALDETRPDFIILYYGHNDFNNTYNGFIIPTYFRKFDYLLALPYLVHDKDRPDGVILSADWYWYARLMRPRIIRACEQLRLLDIRSAAYDPVNRLIVETFRRNNEAIISRAAARKVPVVLITPVGNLRAEPYGDLATTTALYRQGMADTDYARSLSLLKQARDAEILTYDLRAKSALLDVIRSSERPGVYVLDLERELEQRHFSFGYDDFLDYFHFNDRSHRLVAQIIRDFLVRHRLLEQRAHTPASAR